MSEQARRLGVDFKNEGAGNELSSQEMLECARLAERLGYDSVWLNEDIGRDSTVLLAAMSSLTSSIGLGTAIMNVYSRSALQVAMAIATLDDLSRGRATLGLSVGHHPWNDLGHGIPLEAPVARIREYVEFVRKALTSQPFTHNGRFFKGVDTRLSFHAPRPDLPIYIGGERPRMVEAAAQVADGLIMNVVSPYYIANFAAEHFRASARKAGRDPNRLELLGIVTCCLADDRQEAMANARTIFLKRFSTNPSKMLETQPPALRDELRALKELIDGGQAQRAREEASEELVTSIVAAGNTEDIWRGIDAYASAGCTRLAVAAYPRGKASVERMLKTLAPGPSQVRVSVQ